MEDILNFSILDRMSCEQVYKVVRI